MLDATIFDNNFFHEREKKEFNFWKEGSIEEIDEKDRILLNALHKNGKETLLNLASKAGLSIDATSKRIKKLNDKKIICFYTTSINYTLLGYEKYKLFIEMKNYSNNFEEEFYGFLRKYKETLNVIKTIGPWKFEVEFLIA